MKIWSVNLSFIFLKNGGKTISLSCRVQWFKVCWNPQMDRTPECRNYELRYSWLIFLHRCQNNLVFFSLAHFVFSFSNGKPSSVYLSVFSLLSPSPSRSWEQVARVPCEILVWSDTTSDFVEIHLLLQCQLASQSMGLRTSVICLTTFQIALRFIFSSMFIQRPGSWYILP